MPTKYFKNFTEDPKDHDNITELIQHATLFEISSALGAKVLNPNTYVGCDNYKITLLRIAADNNRADVIELLVKAGANLEAKDFHGFTPLQNAVMMETHEAIEMLVRLGADTTVKFNSGYGLVEYAKATGAEETASLLEKLTSKE